MDTTGLTHLLNMAGGHIMLLETENENLRQEVLTLRTEKLQQDQENDA